MTDYANLPKGATLEVKPFTAHVSEEKLQHFNKLLELSPTAPATFENSSCGRRYGITKDWLDNAKHVWLNQFDWRKHEDRINSFPNFKATVKDTAGNNIEIQFLALFSEKEDAIPIGFFHGWPSSVCEFIDILDILKNKYSTKDLPYHVIAPSLPGYAYSSGPPVDKDYGIDIAAGALHNLMIGLGFGSGYLAHGGDLGSFMSRILATKYEACKGMHVNMMLPPSNMTELPAGEEEQAALTKMANFGDIENAFLLEQGTKTATIGHVLSASPLALLSWLGEKFLAWTDEDPPLEKILEEVTLYWMTDTIPRCLYHNRGAGDPTEEPKIARLSVMARGGHLNFPYVDKPTGYSLFAHEIIPSPKSWADQSANIVFFRKHERGGHFAAMERPVELLQDIGEYAEKVWKSAK